MPRKYGVGYRATGNYGEFEVVEYIDKSRVRIVFLETGFEVWCASSNVAKGTVRDPYFRSVYGIGYIGNTSTSIRVGDKNILKQAYNTWHDMLRRCCSDTEGKMRTYEDCYVCEEWLCFENYEIWFDSNFVEGYQVDKDFLYLGNRKYSPNTCVFIPREINATLGYKTNNTCRKKAYSDLPVGVSFHKRDKIFTARCWCKGRLKSLGYHATPELAFKAYKEFKESRLKILAEHYFLQGSICEKVYKNLLNYVVYPEGHSYYLKNYKNTPST